MNIGDTISGSETLNVPVGAVLRRGSHRYRRIMSGYVDERHRLFHPGAWYSASAEVVEMPDELPPIPYDLRRQWITTTLRGIASQHGGGYLQEAQRHFPEMEAYDPTPLWPVGAFIHSADTQTHPIPEGLVVDFGHAAEQTGLNTIHAWRNSRWVSVIGAGLNEFFTGRIIGNPEHDEVFAPEYRDGDAQRIAAFERKVWDVGYNIKRSQSWCETYEACMVMLGMDQMSVLRTLEPGGIGNGVTTEEAAALPVGTVLRSGTGLWALFVRGGNVHNAARTMRIAGHPEDNRQSCVRMIIEHRPDRDMEMLIDLGNTNARLDALPAGSRIRFHAARDEYDKLPSGQWQRVDYNHRYDSHQFGGTRSLVRLPEIA